MLREFAIGVRMLGRGFGFWRSRPGVMWSGLVPAAIAFVLLAGALVALGLNLPGLVEWATPFADGWNETWRGALRITLAAVLFAAALVLAAVTFTALTLAIGEPFYERISHAVDAQFGGDVPESGGGFWRGIVDALQLFGLGILTAIAMFLIGLIPVVGSIVAAVLGFLLTARLLARELTSRAFETRGLPLPARRKLLSSRRWRVLGFGVATQACFLVPLGAIVVMPAAVAGATLLARELETGPHP